MAFYKDTEQEIIYIVLAADNFLDYACNVHIRYTQEAVHESFESISVQMGSTSIHLLQRIIKCLFKLHSFRAGNTLSLKQI